MIDEKEEAVSKPRPGQLTSYRQAFIRASYDAVLLAFFVCGPGRWWVRLVLCLAVRFLIGVVATSTRLGRWL